uniref:Bromo domain-containing protein n=1 Tax=Caenorhabditis tropicalis TaxID=1561998 RepID=A0A1I7UJJ3_9PELO
MGIRLRYLAAAVVLCTIFYYADAQGLNDPITQYIEGRLGNRRIFWCPSGYGYLAFCPQPTDWDNYNWCCTFPYMGSWKPSCCQFAIPTGAVVAIILAAIVLLEKIEDGLYSSLPEMRDDCQLIVSNALQYNQPTTVFYLAAKRLSNLISYYFGEPYLRFLFHTLPSANKIPFELVGIRPLASMPSDRPINRRRGVVRDEMTSDECLQKADAKIRNRLSSKPLPKLGFLSERNGTVVLNVVAGGGEEDSAPRRVTIGDVVGPLEEGTTGMIQMQDHRLFSQSTVNYLNYGPFSSFAPMYDSTWATMTKQETDLFLRTYGDKQNARDATSMRSFVENCPEFLERGGRLLTS